MSTRSTASSTSYGGSESWSVWFGRSSALGALSMLAAGIGGCAKPNSAKRALSMRAIAYTSVL